MKLISFQQTPFVNYDDMQLCRITIGDWDFCNPYQIRFIVDGKVVLDIENFKYFAEVLIPTQKTEKSCILELVPFEDIPVIYTINMKPVKKWNIPILYSSHEDLGYCAYANKLEYQLYEFVIKAMKLCDENPDFCYVIEHTEWLRYFEYYATEAEKKQLQRLFKEKRIELSVIPCGVHTSWADGEQLIRSVQPAVMDAHEKWQISPCTALYADLSGASWQTVSAYASQGVKYLIILDNMFRKPNRAGDPPKFFKWVAPNGKDSMFVWYPGTSYRDDVQEIWCDTNRQYQEGTFTFDETHARLTANMFADRLEALGDVPYSNYPIGFYDDHEVPNSQLLTICRYMNKKWKTPQFHMELPAEFLASVEIDLGDQVPVLKGDMVDQWADFASIVPNYMAAKREAMNTRLGAEMLATFKGIENPSYVYAKSTMDDIFRRANMFDEHCYATSSKHPQKMHIFNMNYVKRFSAELALKETKDILAKLENNLETANGLCSVLPYESTYTLKVKKDEKVPADVQTQQLPDGTFITSPVKFDAVSTKKCSKELTKTPIVSVDTDTFETPFYLVTIDHRKEQIKQIYDKRLKRNLLDEDAAYPLGTYLYTLTPTGTDPSLAVELPKRRGLSIEKGDVAYVVTIKGYEEQSMADVENLFIFYLEDPTIDLKLSYKNATGLMGDYSDRYRKNIFYSFPFQMDGAYDFFTQLPGGKAYSIGEKIGLCPYDFSLAEHYCKVEGPNGGIALRSQDTPTFHYGDIHYNQFLLEPNIKHPHMYLYAASNRTNNLIYRGKEDCFGNFRLSILPYLNGEEEMITAWDNQLTYPPVAVQTSSDLSIGFDVNQPLRLLTVHPAVKNLHAIVVRFSETNGKKYEKVQVSLPFSVKKASIITPDERFVKETSVKGNQVFFDIDAYDYVSILVEGDFTFAAEKETAELIQNIIMIPVENERSIICFEKNKDLTGRKFRILENEQILAEVENDIYHIQSIELASRPQNFRVEII